MEYKFVEWYGTSAEMEDTLNTLAKDEWRVVQVLESSILLCRSIPPTSATSDSTAPSEDQTSADNASAA